MTTVTQMLCGEINLFDTVDGLEVLRPHPLQLAEGRCAHSDLEEWERRTRHLAGMAYLGRGGDVEWPVHLWADGSLHGKEVDPSWPVTEKREDKALAECEHAEHYACAAVKTKSAPGELGPHPEPAVSSRTGGDGGVVPSAVMKLQERAREAGWEVRLQYAKGRAVHGSTGRPLAEKESWALVFHSHPMAGKGAYAVYRGGAWDSVNVAGKLAKGVTPLVEFLENFGSNLGESAL